MKYDYDDILKAYKTVARKEVHPNTNMDLVKCLLTSRMVGLFDGSLESAFKCIRGLEKAIEHAEVIQSEAHWYAIDKNRE